MGTFSFSFSRSFGNTAPALDANRNSVSFGGGDDVIARTLTPGEQALYDALIAGGESRLDAYRTVFTQRDAATTVLNQLTALGVPLSEAASLYADGTIQRPLTTTEFQIYQQLTLPQVFIGTAGARGLYAALGNFYDSNGIIPGAADDSVAVIDGATGLDPSTALGLIFGGEIRRIMPNITLPYPGIGNVLTPYPELYLFHDLQNPDADFLQTIFVGSGTVGSPSQALDFAGLIGPLDAGPAPAPNVLPPDQIVGVPENAAFGGNDSIRDSGGDNLIVDLIGNNRINTGKGDDEILLGTGNDTVYDRGGSNTIIDLGGDNNITVRSTYGAGASEVDIITTGDGNDQINAFDGRNEIDAGNGNNNVRGGDNYDFIKVGLGDDIVDVRAGTFGETEEAFVDLGGGFTIPLSGPLQAHNRIEDQGGSDIFRASATPEVISDDPTFQDQVFNGNDFVVSDLSGVVGNDIARLGDGDNVYVDAGGNDDVTTGRGTDSIFTSLFVAGNDIINAGAGNDTVAPGPGSDRVRAGGGSDLILLDPDGVVDTLIWLTADLDGGVDLITDPDVLRNPDGTFAGPELTLVDLLDVSGVAIIRTPGGSPVPLSYDDYIATDSGVDNLVNVAFDINGDDAFTAANDLLLAQIQFTAGPTIPSSVVLDADSFLFA